MPDDGKRVLVRLCDKQLNERAGLLIDDTVRRPVTFRTRKGYDVNECTLDGLALIGPDEGPNGVEDIRRHVGECLLKILSTDEVWWLPLNAIRDALTGLWTIEAVPLVEWTRKASQTDEHIMTASGYDPDSGQPMAEAHPDLVKPCTCGHPYAEHIGGMICSQCSTCVGFFPATATPGGPNG